MPDFPPLFFEVYESLPRQGPGNRENAERALSLCKDLPDAPAVVDLGCGVGGQTLHLAELTSGTIVAIDAHAPSVDIMNSTVGKRGLADRILPMVGDMSKPGLDEGSFDLVWSEGALYNIGIPKAMEVCKSLLKRGGYVAFTDAVWRKDDPPESVKSAFDADYPAMGRVEDVIAAIADSGLELVDHFTLSDEAWWDDFYTPMQNRVEELRSSHKEDAEALAVLDEIAGEPEMHRKYCEYYAYEFFVARRG